jgi:hypothetical protein
MGKRSRVNTGNLQTITQHRLALGKRERQSQKADQLSDISLSHNFQLSNSLASRFLVTLLMTSAAIGVVNAVQSGTSSLKYDDEGGVDEKAFNRLLASKLKSDVNTQDKKRIVDVTNQMSLKDKKMFTLCLLKMTELDPTAGISTRSKLLGNWQGGFVPFANKADAQHPSLRMFLNFDSKVSDRAMAATAGHESLHCAQFGGNAQDQSMASLINKKFTDGNLAERQKSAMSHSGNFLVDDKRTRECEAFFDEITAYTKKRSDQVHSSSLTPKQEKYFINLGKAVYENMKDLEGMNQIMSVYKTKFRQVFSVDLDEAINGQTNLANRAYLIVGQAFINFFGQQINQWQQIYQNSFCTEAIANFGDIPEAIRKEFHPKMNEFVLNAKETIFTKCLDGLGVAYRKTFDSIFPTKQLGEEVNPDGAVKSKSASKLSGAQVREL